MSSAGHILDMINRMKRNRSLLPSKRQKFKGNNRETIYSGTDGQDKVIFKEFPKEQVDKVVNQIKQDFKAKRRKELTFLISFFGIVGVLIIYAILSSDDNSKKRNLNNTAIEYYSSPPILWSGKRSDPLKVPFSNLFYSPFIGNMDFEVQIDKSYTLYNHNMVVDNTTNILFFDNECVLIGKLLPKFGYISRMIIGPNKKDFGPKKIIYALAERDTNDDGLITANDQHDLYISNLNGTELTKITERRVQSIKWVGQGEVILLEFGSTESKEDSLYGYFNTKTRDLKLTNQTKNQLNVSQ